MTWKDELLMLWIFCTVLISFAARHFFGGAIYLIEHVAAFTVPFLPGVLHMLARHLH